MITTTMEARMENLEKTMEFIKKLTIQHTSQLANLEETIATTVEINIMLKKFMKQEGIPWKTTDEEDDDDATLKSRKWFKNVELPCFKGEDPISWIAMAERFFEIHQIPSEEKLRHAFASMEGAAIHWFRCWQKKNLEAPWESFVLDLIKRFGEGKGGSVFERLSTLRQDDSVEEYVKSFEYLVAQIDSIKEEHLLGYFLAGLEPDLRSKLRVHEPFDLSEAIELAHGFEDDLDTK